MGTLRLIFHTYNKFKLEKLWLNKNTYSNNKYRREDNKTENSDSFDITFLKKIFIFSNQLFISWSRSVYISDISNRLLRVFLLTVGV